MLQIIVKNKYVPFVTPCSIVAKSAVFPRWYSYTVAAGYFSCPSKNVIFNPWNEIFTKEPHPQKMRILTNWNVIFTGGSPSKRDWASFE